MKRVVTVRLSREVERLVEAYAEANDISTSEAVRELLHFFKFIVRESGAIDELRELAEINGDDPHVMKPCGGCKINVSLTGDDIEFLNTVSSIIGVNRSTALRFSILTLYSLLNMLIHSCVHRSEDREYK